MSPSASPRPAAPRARLLVLPALALVATACGGEGGGRSRRQGAAGCDVVDSAALVRAALLQFVATTNPKPLRFLFIPATDSSFPDAAVQALQDKGPTYMFPADSAQQQVVREKLSDSGPWNALLVLYQGTTAAPPDSASVRLAGRFVGSDNDGQAVPTRVARFTCGTVGDSAHRWQLVPGPGDQAP